MKIVGTISALALSIGGLTACGELEDEPDYAAICVDPVTEERVADSRCDNSSSEWTWFYYAMSANHRVPPVGYRINPQHGTTKVPKTAAVQRGGLPATGSSSLKKAYQNGTKTGGFGTSRNGGTTTNNKPAYKAPAPASRPATRR